MTIKKTSTNKFKSFLKLQLLLTAILFIYASTKVKAQCPANKICDTFDVTTYGANPNDVFSDVSAIKTAIDSATFWIGNYSNRIGIIKFPAASGTSGSGVYLIDSYDVAQNGYLNNHSFLLSSNLVFWGTNRNKSIIRLADNMLTGDTVNGHNPNVDIFYGNNISNVVFANLTIDMNGIHNLVKANEQLDPQPAYAIKIEGDINSSNIIVDNVTIKNSPGHNDIYIVGQGSNVTIKNSKFLNGGWNVGSATIANSNNKDFSFLFCDWDNTTFKNDSIIQEFPDIALQHPTGGIEIHGSNTTVNNCYIYSCRPGIYITSSKGNSTISTLQNVIIKNSKLLYCTTGIQFWVNGYINGVDILNNKITLTYPRPHDTASMAIVTGLLVPGGNDSCAAQYEIFGNANNDSLNDITIRNNSISSEVPDDDKYLTTGMIIHSFKNSTIDSNHISGMNWEGIYLQGSRWGMSNTTISYNTIDSFKLFHGPVTYALAYILATDRYWPNSDCSNKQIATFKNINISNNSFYSNSMDQIEAGQCSNTTKIYACFRKFQFSLPTWYAYTTVNGCSSIMDLSIFNISNNAVYNDLASEGQCNGAYPCTQPCSSYIYNNHSIRNEFANNEQSHFTTKINVFPNPLKQNFAIHLSSIAKTLEIFITDISGRQVYYKLFSNTSFQNISFNQPKGIYIARIISDNENFIQKLIVE